MFVNVQIRNVLPSMEREGIAIFLTNSNSLLALFSASTALSTSSLVLNVSEIMCLDTALACEAVALMKLRRPNSSRNSSFRNLVPMLHNNDYTIILACGMIKWIKLMYHILLGYRIT